jgi:hypothetical protein
MTTDMTARGPLLLVAAVASAAAGLVHAAAAGSHNEIASLARLFALAAALQLGWAALVVIHPKRWLAGAGMAVNASMVLAWAMSRTVGWPVIEAMSTPSSVGASDLVAVALAVVATVAAGAAWIGVQLPRAVAAAPVSALATVLLLGAAVPAMAADDSHDHGHGGDHAHHADGDHADGDHGDGDHADHGDGVHADGDHAPGEHDDGHGHDGAGSAYDHSDPIISFDDPRLTANQRAAAIALYDDVVREMARFSDPASVEAEGYQSIGDGVTGFEHFSHPELRMDPITLDPRRPESLVFRINADGTKELVTAMFIMPPGRTIDDVPDIAGTLTTWHDHQDLCWMGNRVVGVTSTPGECAFGEFRVGQPMMHVWLVPHPCGPFAGLEGHGGSCSQHGH